MRMILGYVILSMGLAALFAIPLASAAVGMSFSASPAGFFVGFFLGLIPAGVAYGAALHASVRIVEAA